MQWRGLYVIAFLMGPAYPIGCRLYNRAYLVGPISVRSDVQICPSVVGLSGRAYLVGPISVRSNMS